MRDIFASVYGKPLVFAMGEVRQLPFSPRVVLHEVAIIIKQILFGKRARKGIT